MMHDNTSMTLCELSEATQNKSTRGDYHKECCAKGGNITQPCGFNCDKDLTFRFLIFTFQIKLDKILKQTNRFQDYFKNNFVVSECMKTFGKCY